MSKVLSFMFGNKVGQLMTIITFVIAMMNIFSINAM